MTKLLKLSIKLYQKILSSKKGILRKLLPEFFGCRFFPTCSEYTLQAVEKYGTFKGCFLGIKRISKCHPFGKGGYDPVP